MKQPADIRRTLSLVFIVSSCVGLFIPPAMAAGGISIHYGNQHHGVSIGHHQSHGAAGNIKPRRHSHHHNFSVHAPHNYYNYQYYSYPRYRPYTSPRRRYYGQQYTQPYLDSRFPNSYRNYSYYQQTQPRSYGSHSNNPVNAWETLAQGQAHIALNQFGAEAQSHPRAGIPKIGYALASATSGDLDQGVIAMRRAFSIDPASLHHYQVDQHLHAMINDLIAKYQYSLNHRGRHKDEAFMVAALSYLNNDYTTAHEALERAKRDGDRSHSLRNLREFLEETQYSTR